VGPAVRASSRERRAPRPLVLMVPPMPSPSPQAAGSEGARSAPVQVIRPTSGWAALDAAALWRHRELLLFMALRDVKLRYRQTLLGAGWAILQPLSTALVFTVFFGRLGGLPSDGAPYALFALCGLVPWQLFSQALLQSSDSLVESRAILSKVYFPRIIIPFSKVGAGLLDFAISLALLGLALLWYRVALRPGIAAVPLLAILALVSALGAGLWLATLNVRYRDIKYTVPFLTQLWLFATPVAYPASVVPERYRAWLGLNPMAGVVEGFRWALLGTPAPAAGLLAVSSATAVLLLVTGLFYFRRMERHFADVI